MKMNLQFLQVTINLYSRIEMRHNRKKITISGTFFKLTKSIELNIPFVKVLFEMIYCIEI